MDCVGRMADGTPATFAVDEFGRLQLGGDIGGATLAFDALGMDPTTGEMLGVIEGVGALQDGRASSIWLPDYEGVYQQFLNNEPGWSGGRVVRNELHHSEDFAHADWGVAGGAVKIGVVPGVGPNGEDAYEFSMTGNSSYFINNSMDVVIGKDLIGRTMARCVSGSATINMQLGSATRTQIVLDNTWADFAGQRTVTIGNSSYENGFRGVDAGVFQVIFFQVEDATGRADINTPSEYVKTEATSAVKVFGTTNGNTVTDNIVTEARGTDLPEMPYVVSAPQATNRIDYSGNYLLVWSKARLDVQGGLPGPSALGDASKLTETVDTGAHYIFISSSLTVSETYGASIIAKAGERSKIALTESGSQSSATIFDLSTGSIVSGDGDIAPLNDGWYRCSRYRTAGTNAFSVNLVDDSNSTSYAGDGVSGLYLQHVQVEDNYPSPPIPTEGVSVERNACSLSLDRSNIPDAEGSLYVEVDGMLAASSSSILSLFLGTISNNVRLNDGGSFTDLTFTDGYLRIGVVWGGGTKRLNVNGVWSTEPAYDGDLPDAVLDLFRNTVSTKSMRNFKALHERDDAWVESEMVA